MSKIILVRHGHVTGISPERFRGRTELVLTEEGQSAAQKLARRIAATWAPAAIYTSPLGRCVTTGRMIGAACGLAAQPLPSLIDIDYGDVQGNAVGTVAEELAALYELWRSAPHLVRFPKGESLQDVALRAADTLRFLAERHDGDTVVLVGHDCINRVLLLHLMDQSLSGYWRLAQAPCCINAIDVTGASALINRINDTSHLA